MLFGTALNFVKAYMHMVAAYISLQLVQHRGFWLLVPLSHLTQHTCSLDEHGGR